MKRNDCSLRTATRGNGASRSTAASRRWRVLAALVFVATMAGPAFAQQRLFAWGAGEVVELDPRLDSLGAVIRRFPLPDRAGDARNKDAVSLVGGELLAWTTQWIGGGVVILNTRSGAAQQFSFPDFLPSGIVGSDGNSRLVVLGTNAAGESVVLIADAQTGDERFINVGTVIPWQRQVAYAPGRDLLFVARQRTARRRLVSRRGRDRREHRHAAEDDRRRRSVRGHAVD